MENDSQHANKEDRIAYLLRKANESIELEQYNIALMCLNRLVIDFEDHADLAGKIISMFDGLAVSDSEQSHSMLLEITNNAAKHSPLKEDLGVEILVLACKPDLDRKASADLNLLAFNILPVNSAASTAAADRLIKLCKGRAAERDIELHHRLKYGRSVLVRLYEADNGADVNAIRMEAAALWLNTLEPLEGENASLVMRSEEWQRNYTLSNLQIILPFMPYKDDPLTTKALNIWQKNIRSFFDSGLTYNSKAFDTINMLAANPRVGGEIEKINNELWNEALDQLIDWSEERDQKKLPFNQCKESADFIYKKSPDPESCSAIKIVMTTRLLDIAQSNRSLPFVKYQAAIEAARYDGNDKALKKRLIKVLTSIAGNENIFNPNQRAEAKEKLSALSGEHPPGNNPNSSLPPPSPPGP